MICAVLDTLVTPDYKIAIKQVEIKKSNGKSFDSPKDIDDKLLFIITTKSITCKTFILTPEIKNKQS